MVKFLCKKLGRDKSLEGFKSQNIKTTYKFLKGHEWQEALKHKLVEEVKEICEAQDRSEMVAELADVLEVISGLCKAYEISLQEVEKIKREKYNERGGFEKGFYLETLEMDEANPRIEYFRKYPDKYPEF